MDRVEVVGLGIRVVGSKLLGSNTNYPDPHYFRTSLSELAELMANFGF